MAWGPGSWIGEVLGQVDRCLALGVDAGTRRDSGYVHVHLFSVPAFVVQGVEPQYVPMGSTEDGLEFVPTLDWEVVNTR